MVYAVVWSYNTPESGQRKKLVSTPESLEATSVDEAKKEGRQILVELAPEQKVAMKPLAVVEINDEMLFGISGCERVFLADADDDGDELEFVDVSQTSYWSSQPWWLS